MVLPVAPLVHFAILGPTHGSQPIEEVAPVRRYRAATERLTRQPPVLARRRPIRATVATTVCQAAYGSASAQLDLPEPPSAQGSLPWTDMLRGNDTAAAGDACVCDMCTPNTLATPGSVGALPDYTLSSMAVRATVPTMKSLVPGGGASTAGASVMQGLWDQQPSAQPQQSEAQSAWTPRLQVLLNVVQTVLSEHSTERLVARLLSLRRMELRPDCPFQAQMSDHDP